MTVTTLHSLLDDLLHLRPWQARLRNYVIRDSFSAVEGGGLVVRVPEFQGSFEIGGRSDILRRLLVYKCYEPELAALVTQYVDPTLDVIDVGANVGFYTVLAARLVSSKRRILSIEPTPEALKLLRNNLQRNNQQSRVIVYEGAATSTRGPIIINMVDGREEYSSTARLVHPAVSGATTIQIEVNGTPIDDLVTQFGLRPGFIKIDTEGTEHDVLLGSETTLTAFRPVVMFECFSDNILAAAGSTPRDTRALFHKHGYQIVTIDDNNYMAIPKKTTLRIP